LRSDKKFNIILRPAHFFYQNLNCIIVTTEAALALTAYGAAVPVRLELSRLDLFVLFCQEKRTKAQEGS
jgi:hypothetical protein